MTDDGPAECSDTEGSEDETVERTVPEKVETLIDDVRETAHLATCRDGRPHVAPLWYRYAGDGVVETVTAGRKLANIRANPRVALSIEAAENGQPEWTVTLRGTATVVDDATETTAANRRINCKYGADDDDWSENTLVRVDVGSASYRTY
jgi:PPOX class probable F420-dependent enzyme